MAEDPGYRGTDRREGGGIRRKREEEEEEEEEYREWEFYDGGRPEREMNPKEKNREKMRRKIVTMIRCEPSHAAIEGAGG